MTTSGTGQAPRTVYLDYAATTPLRAEVLQAMWPYFTERPGNASSLHAVGQQAKRALEESRTSVARCLGCRPDEIVFTSGGTESNNQAIVGAALALRERGRHIVTSAIEHHSVLNLCRWLESQGFQVTFLPVDGSGSVDMQCLRDNLRDDTALVSVMLANNEVGTLQPVAEIARLAHERGICAHTDAVQAVGKLPVDVRNLGVDLLSLTAHKFGGPKGVGALFVRQGTHLVPLFYGGHQERALRPGTQNIPGVVGLAAALRLAQQELATEPARLEHLRDQLEAGILARVPQARINARATQRLPNISNVSFADLDGESLLLALDQRGIAVSTGSACSAGSTEPSHVLQALGAALPGEGALRFSLGHANSEDDVDYTLQTLTEAVAALRGARERYTQP